MQNTNVVELKYPEGNTTDLLTDIIRRGARELLTEAFEAEVETFIAHFRELRTSEGKQRVIRNGYLPEREIQTGVGSVPVKVPRVRDNARKTESPIVFQSVILPPYLRKSKSMEELLPYLYLKGISTGDIGDALKSIIGEGAKGFSSSVVSRLKLKWEQACKDWKKRSLLDKQYAYIWVDGIHCNVRMDDKQCLLVVIGANHEGKKELIAIEEGYRESEQSWLELLQSLYARGLHESPQLAIGDGALGFWKAVSQVYPDTKWQRCWCHKTGNVLNKMPKTVQPKAKQKIQDIWMAETKEEAQKAWILFIKTYQAKYDKAVNCLEKDKEALLAFYDFPAEHWKHIRTTNPIESTFATVRLRTAKVRGCFSSKTVVSMAFQLCRSAEKKWHKLNCPEKVIDVLTEKKFVDGIRVDKKAA